MKNYSTKGSHQKTLCTVSLVTDIKFSVNKYFYKKIVWSSQDPLLVLKTLFKVWRYFL